MRTTSAEPVTGSTKRAQEILATATVEFHHRGFHNVSMGDIAARLNMTGPALYRHFPSKDDILASAIMNQISTVRGVVLSVEDASPGVGGQRQVLFSELADLVTRRRQPVLWRREARHLRGEEQSLYRSAYRDVLAATSRILAAAETGTSLDDSEFKARLILAVHAAVGDQPVAMSQSTDRDILISMSEAIADFPLSHATDTAPGGEPMGEVAWSPRGRREKIIESATELFYRHGYHLVSVQQVAKAAGTSLDSFYQEFTAKTALLQAVLLRGSEGLAYSMRHHLAKCPREDDTLAQITQLYVELALGPHARLLRILDADIAYLPDAVRREIRETAREHTEEWTSAIRERRPNLPQAAPSMLTRSSLAVVADATRSATSRSRPHLSSDLCRLIDAMVASA